MHQEIASDAGAVLLPAAPPRECDRIEGPLGRRPQPGVPVEILRREIGRRRILPRPGWLIATERPLDEHQIAEHPLRDHLLRLGENLGAHALRPDLHDATALLRRVRHFHSLRRRVRHRLLAVHVLAGAHRVDQDLPVPVVGHRDDHAIDVPVLEKRLIPARDGEIGPDDLPRQGMPTIVEVTGRDTLDSVEGYRVREQSLPLHPDTDDPEPDPIARWSRPRALRSLGAQQLSTPDERCTGGDSADLEELSTRNVAYIDGTSGGIGELGCRAVRRWHDAGLIATSNPQGPFALADRPTCTKLCAIWPTNDARPSRPPPG